MSNFDPQQLQTPENLTQIFDASPAGILIVDRDGRIQMLNQQVVEWFGYAREELLGEPVEKLLPERYRHGHVSMRHNYSQAPVTRPMGRGEDLLAQRSNGNCFPVDISLHPLKLGDQQTVILTYIVDATERKAQEKLQKLALLGQLAASVAHEIRNPLGVIRNSSYYLNLLDDQLEKEARECVEDIDREVENANRIVNELLDFTRESTPTSEVFPLREAVQQALEYARVPESIQVELDVDEVNVTADRGQIERLLSNVIRNAVQASDESGVIRVQTTITGNQVQIEIADQGTGIASEHLTKIFEPLFTTKAKGVGLGLALARRYAEGNGGQLKVASTSETGTTFCLILPCEGN